MAFTADEIANINNTTLKAYLNKGTLFKQNVQNKPMLDAFNRTAGSFPGGNGFQVSIGVKSGQGGGSLQGYSGDDKVSYYNPATAKRVEYTGKEHHIGMVMTFSELKQNGIEVTVNDSLQGFIKRNELAKERSEQRPDRFAVGEKVDARIISIDPKTHKLTLSIKAREVEEEKQAMAEFGSADSGASLGDILGAALKKKQGEEKK